MSEQAVPPGVYVLWEGGRPATDVRVSEGPPATIDSMTSEPVLYLPFDQEEHLGPPPWTQDDAGLAAWEAGHGHDVRLKCYVEFGCQAIENLVTVLTGRVATAEQDRDAAVADARACHALMVEERVKVEAVARLCDRAERTWAPGSQLHPVVSVVHLRAALVGP